MKRSLPVSEEGPLPQLVRSRVALARRGLISVRWFQSACMGAGAVGLALAVGVFGGEELFSPGLLTIAVVNGLLVLGVWATQHHRTQAQVARGIDTALECEGALFTAWELEGHTQASGLAGRLGREVAASAPPRTMMAAILPATVPMLAVPFAALALLFTVLEDSREDPSGANIQELMSQMEQGLARLSAGGDGAGEGSAQQDLSAAEQRDLQILLREAGQLGSRLARGEATEQELAEMAAELAQAEAELGPRGGENLREGLNRTQTALDAARMALEGAEGGGVQAGSDELAQGGDEGGPGSSSGTGLASPESDGTLSRPDTQPIQAIPGQEAGILARPSWPMAYDGIVQRWIETVRR